MFKMPKRNRKSGGALSPTFSFFSPFTLGKGAGTELAESSKEECQGRSLCQSPAEAEEAVRDD